MGNSAGFIRYFKGENIKPYLKILLAVHNMKAMVKASLNRMDLPLLYLQKQHWSRVSFDYVLCHVMPYEDLWMKATKSSV